MSSAHPGQTKRVLAALGPAHAGWRANETQPRTSFTLGRVRFPEDLVEVFTEAVKRNAPIDEPIIGDVDL